MTSTGGDSIGHRTLRGTAWAYSSYVGGRLLVLVATAILARLLSPEEFGLVAFALVFTALLESVADLGLTQALIAVKGDDEAVHARADTVFAFSVGLGLVMTLATLAIAPLASRFFDEPSLTPLMAALGANFLLRSLGTTHRALTEKNLDFRARTIAEISDVVLRGLTGVGLALAGAGAWSLVIGYLVGTATVTIVLWLLVPYRPRRPRGWTHLRELIGFGGAISGVTVLGAVMSNADYLFIGRVLGATSLGLYTLAFRLPELVIVNISIVAGEVLFPALARVDPGALGRAFLVSLRYTLMFGLPLAAGLFALAEPVVLVVFGDQWTQSVAPMQVLTVFALAVAIGIPAGSVYKAVGRAGILLKLAIPRACLVVASIAIFVPHGIVAVAACQAAVAGLFAVIGIALASRLLGVGLRAIWAEAWPSIVATLGLLAAVVAIERAIEAPLAAVVAGGLVGAAVYVGLLSILARDWLSYLLATARRSPRVAPQVAGDAEA